MRSFQQKVGQWMLACFGEAITQNNQERNLRFAEEAVELVQANGMTKAEMLAIVDYVFDRPVGELSQEVGGVMVTLAALCNTRQLDIETCANTEEQRIWDVIPRIQAKQAAKPNYTTAFGQPSQAFAYANKLVQDKVNEVGHHNQPNLTCEHVDSTVAQEFGAVTQANAEPEKVAENKPAIPHGRLPAHLNLSVMSQHYAADTRPAVEVIESLGIKYQDAVSQPAGERWVFFNCENIPINLPSYITVINQNPYDMVSGSFTKARADEVVKVAKELAQRYQEKKA